MVTDAQPARGAAVAGGAMAAVTAQAGLYVINFATSVMLARAVGPEGRGQYTIASMAVAVTLLVASFGVETANSVFYAERGRSLADISRSSSLLALVISPFAVLALALAYAGLHAGAFAGLTWSEMAFAFAAVPFALHTLWLANIFLLAKRYPRSQLAVGLGGVAQLVTVLGLTIAGRLDVPTALVAYLVGVITPWALLVAWSRSVAPVAPARDFTLARQLVKLGMQFQIGLLFFYLLLRFDTFLVAGLGSARELGLYSLGVIFADLVWLVTNPLAKAIMPFQAELGRTDAAVLSFKASRISAVIATAIGLFFAATLWAFIPFVYGQDFAAAYPATIALLPGTIFMAAVQPLGLLIAREQRPRRYLIVTLSSFVLNLVLNVVLIAAIGIVGASIASSVAYAVFFTAMALWGAGIGQLRLREVLVPRHSDLESVTLGVRRLWARG